MMRFLNGSARRPLAVCAPDLGAAGGSHTLMGPDQGAKSFAERYAEAGVNIEAGYEVQRLIRQDLAKTWRIGADSDIGGFGGLFDLSALGAYKEPVLVSGTDGVGTKLFLAFMLDKHDTVGQDAVAMCVNDVLVQGAEPLFFLDYLALSEAKPGLVAELVSGVAGACRESGCALIGGETAEMNDLYAPGHYDIAGFATGIVEKSQMITGEKVKPGDLLLGLPSSGVHSNGFSLLRKVFFKDHNYTVHSEFPELEQPLGLELLTPTRLYVRPVLPVLKQVQVHGMSHITGGGFFENIPRMTSNDVDFVIQKGSWEIPAIFDLTERVGELSRREMFNVFNMGIGFVMAIAEEDLAKTQTILSESGQDSFVIGQVTAPEGSEGEVRFV